MAEREGFEPPIALRLCLISSQVHSTGLCHLSAFSLPSVIDTTGRRLPLSSSWRNAPGVQKRIPDGQRQDATSPPLVYRQMCNGCNAGLGRRRRVRPCDGEPRSEEHTSELQSRQYL